MKDIRQSIYNYGLLLGLCYFVTSIQAQKTQVNDDNSIKSQFETLIKKSNNYQNYKVVDKKSLTQLNQNVNDSLLSQIQKLDLANRKLDAQQKEINSLLTDLEGANTTVVKLNEEKNKISLFGISMNKLAYNGLLWSIIAALIGGLLFFMLQFKRGHTVNAQSKRALNKIQDEFEAFRKRTLEKEQVLKRQLQDEINRRSNLP